MSTRKAAAPPQWAFPLALGMKIAGAIGVGHFYSQGATLPAVGASFVLGAGLGAAIVILAWTEADR